MASWRCLRIVRLFIVPCEIAGEPNELTTRNTLELQHPPKSLGVISPPVQENFITVKEQSATCDACGSCRQGTCYWNPGTPDGWEGQPCNIIKIFTLQESGEISPEILFTPPLLINRNISGSTWLEDPATITYILIESKISYIFLSLFCLVVGIVLNAYMFTSQSGSAHQIVWHSRWNSKNQNLFYLGLFTQMWMGGVRWY